jgi:flagellar motor switch protein FliG
MIKTEADLAKLSHRRREVLTALARQLSKDKVAKLSRAAEAIAKIDAEELLQAYETIQEALRKLEGEGSTARSVNSALASLAREWSAVSSKEKVTTQEPRERRDNSVARPSKRRS